MDTDNVQKGLVIAPKIWLSVSKMFTFLDCWTGIAIDKTEMYFVKLMWWQELLNNLLILFENIFFGIHAFIHIGIYCYNCKIINAKLLSLQFMVIKSLFIYDVCIHPNMRFEPQDKHLCLYIGMHSAWSSMLFFLNYYSSICKYCIHL